MSRKLLSIVLGIVMTVSLLTPVSVMADTITPDDSWYVGHESDTVFTLEDEADLMGLVSVINSGAGGTFYGKTIKLGRDMVLNDGDSSDWGSSAPDNVWNTPTVAFNGTFDGQGHFISGVYSSKSGNVGLFGELQVNACIENLTINNSFFSSTAYVGAVCWCARGTITNVSLTSSVIVRTTGTYWAGGLAGYIHASGNAETVSKIENCSSAASVSGINRVGGVVGGVNNYGSYIIKDNTFTGTVTGSVGVGGIVGDQNNNTPAVTISGCTNAGTVNGDYAVAGICGQISAGSSSISDCTNTGTVTGTTSNCDVSGTNTKAGVGGIAGRTVRTMQITDCINSGVVSSAYGRTGGILGTTAAAITVSISYCSVTGDVGMAGKYCNGGVVAQNLQNSATIRVERCYVNPSSLLGGNTNLVIGWGGSSALNILNLNYVPSNTNYTQSGNCGTESTVVIADGSFSGDTISIENANRLYTVAYLTKGSVFTGATLQLTDDIDLQGIVFPMIGSTSKRFAGTFDGQNNTISNLNLSGAANQGFFVSVGGGTVQSLVLEDASVTSSFSGQGGRVGMLVGDVRGGTYSDVTVTDATVSASSAGQVGGLFGASLGPVATVNDCSFSGSVTGTAQVGGIVGVEMNAAMNMDGVTVSADITGDSTTDYNGVGGVVGHNYSASTISNADVSGSVTGGGNYTGGVVGYAQSSVTVSGAFVSADVTSTYASGYVGGVIGNSQGSVTVSNSAVSGTVSGMGIAAGGVIGRINTTASVSGVNCTATITNSLYHIGGIIGGIWGTSSSASVTNTRFGGVAEATNPAATAYGLGGVLGVFNDSTQTATITDVLVDGVIRKASGNSFQAGIASHVNAGTPAINATRVLVTGSLEHASNASGQIGAFLGKVNSDESAHFTGTLTDCYATEDVCKQGTSGTAYGLIGYGTADIEYSPGMRLTKAQLAGVKARTNAAGLFANGGDDNWKSVLAAYPVLAAFSDAVEIIAQYEADISSYRGATYTAPTGPAGTIFAGWYTSDAMTTALGENVTTGAAYAKFVDEEVLKVRSELLTEGEHDKIRIVTTADSLKLSSIGFVLEYSDGTTSKTKDLNATTVYSRLTGWTDPSVFSIESSHFCSYKLNAASELKTIIDEGDGIDVTPYWITLDGTRVSGPTVTGLKFSD